MTAMKVTIKTFAGIALAATMGLGALTLGINSASAASGQKPGGGQYGETPVPGGGKPGGGGGYGGKPGGYGGRPGSYGRYGSRPGGYGGYGGGHGGGRYGGHGNRPSRGIVCYNIAGKPYVYKGGRRCPIS